MGANADNPLVSILVPFYNIENCVNYCLDSLLNQTYGDYEIICVDDGSTDGTYQKLLAYESSPKIKLIKTDNGGLSRARNVAVENAKGEYVTFVDGDDVISPHYLEFLVHALVESESDQAIGEITTVLMQGDRPEAQSWPESLQHEKLGLDQMVHRFLYETANISACCHLAKRQLYVEHPFPEGKLYEDTLTFKDHIMSSGSFAFVRAPLYGYVKRWNSITKPHSVSLVQVNEFGSTICQFENEIMQRIPSEKGGVVFHTALEYSRLFRLTQSVDDEEVAYWQEKALRYVKRHLKELCSDKEIPKSNKLRFTILSFLPSCYDRIFSAYESIAFRKGAV